MTDWDFITTVLGRVIKDFTEWMLRWCPGEEGRAYAASSVATWLYDAAQGQETSYGPYRMLYANGEFHLRQHERHMLGDVPFGIWRTIPVPPPDLLCDLTRVYIFIHLATEYSQVSSSEQIQLYRMATKMRYNIVDQYQMPLGDQDMPKVVALVNRMLEALHHHRINCAGDCSSVDQLWHDEDNRATRWLAHFRAESRDTFNGF